MSSETDRRKLELPDRRQNTYEELSHRLDKHVEKIEADLNDHAEHLENRLSRFFSKALIAFAVIGIISAGSLLGFGWVLQSIQDQRKSFVRRSCLETNHRHDKTSAKLIALAKQDEDARTTKAGKLEVRRRRDVTLGLIDALAPKQNCDAQVKKATDSAKAEAKPGTTGDKS